MWDQEGRYRKVSSKVPQSCSWRRGGHTSEQSLLGRAEHGARVVYISAINSPRFIRPTPPFPPKMQIPSHFQQPVCRPESEPSREKQVLAVENEAP